MIKIEDLIKLLSVTALLFYGQSAFSAVMNGVSVPLGQTVTVNSTDTMTADGYGEILGTLNNYGLIKDDGETFIGGILNNHGIIHTEKAFSIVGGGDETSRKIINHADGLIVLTGYIDMYSNNSLLDNAGRIIVTREVGDGTYGFYGFTAGLIRGTINNTGSFLFDRNNGLNICGNAGIANVFNAGLLEVANGTNCDFGENSVTSKKKTTYKQIDGETRVNGIFGAHEITINEGVISGSGTIQGYFKNYPLFDKVTIAPGSSLETGTLTLIPDETYLICVRCSIAIELTGAANVDQVHVDGTFYMNSWKLNVQLRDGYVPAAGTSFTVVSADSVYYYGPAPTYNLPELPDGRTWDVQNNGTEVILTAN